jgi:hypothetical protein
MASSEEAAVQVWRMPDVITRPDERADPNGPTTTHQLRHPDHDILTTTGGRRHIAGDAAQRRPRRGAPAGTSGRRRDGWRGVREVAGATLGPEGAPPTCRPRSPAGRFAQDALRKTLCNRRGVCAALAAARGRRDEGDAWATRSGFQAAARQRAVRQPMWTVTAQIAARAGRLASATAQASPQRAIEGVGVEFIL